MRVRLARTAGFCMGVRRAMGLVLSEANRSGAELYTLGPLIHNTQVLNLLSNKGVKSVSRPEDLASGCRVVIRAHGIPPETRRKLRKAGARIIDATCPKVARVQSLIRYYTKKGYCAVIVGEEDHAEVLGLLGYCETKPFVIRGPEEAERIQPRQPVFVVAQTTQNSRVFQEVVSVLRRRFSDLLVFDTICGATEQRQQEVRTLAAGVDGFVVVGGYHSGNTRRLVEIAKESGKAAFHVETEKDLEKESLAGLKTVGVTAGASTPNWMINNVVREIEGIRSLRESGLWVLTRRFFRFLLLSNLFAAAGAFSLAFAVDFFVKKAANIPFPLIAFFYVYAMHVLNRFLDKGASAYNDPERAAFLNKYKWILIISGTAAISAAMVLAFQISGGTFIALCAITFLGVIYSVPLLPGTLKDRSGYAKIKDVPGSKTLSQALGWTAVICVLPLLGMDGISWAAWAFYILIVLSMTYVRSCLFDILQVQGDLVVGSETLPVALGEKKTIRLLKSIIISTGFILIFASSLAIIPARALILAVPIAGQLICTIAYERRLVRPRGNFEAFVESNFFAAGILTLLLVVW